MASSKANSKAAREATPTLGLPTIDYRPTRRQYERYALWSALVNSPLRVLVFGLQTATWKLVARGDVARSAGLTNSLIARRLSLCLFCFEAVYRIAGPVLAPYAAPVPASATAAAATPDTAAAHALAPAPCSALAPASGTRTPTAPGSGTAPAP